MKTAEGGGVRALTGVRDRRNRILSAVFDLYSPLTLLKLKKKLHFKMFIFFYYFLTRKTLRQKLIFFFRKYSNIWQNIIFDENIHIFLVWTRMQFLLQCVDDWVFIRGSFRFYETCNFDIGNACSFWWKLPLPHWLLLFLVR